MAVNRIQAFQLITRRPAKAKRPAAPVMMIPSGFVMCPPQLGTASAWQQQIYRMAYEKARAAAEIPRHHRVLFSVWN